MIIFLYGTDTYRLKQKLCEIKKSFVEKKGETELSISNINPIDLNIDNIRKTMLSTGLFAQKRLIIINGLLNSYKKQQETDPVVEEVINILKKTHSEKDNVIIFIQNEIQEKELSALQKKLYIFLKKEKRVQKFDLLKPDKIKTWINKYMADNNESIEQSGINLLIDVYENNLWAIKNELDKLISYNKGKSKPIDSKDIQDIVFYESEQSIWQLIDAIGQKDIKSALKILSNQIKQGLSIDYIISMLAYQYRTIFRIKSYIENNKTESLYNVAKSLSIKPFVCQKIIMQEKKYTLQEIKKIYEQLLQIDFLRKTRSINAQALLDLLIIKNNSNKPISVH